MKKMKQMVRFVLITGLLLAHVGDFAHANEYVTALSFPGFKGIQRMLARQPNFPSFDGTGFQLLASKRVMGPSSKLELKGQPVDAAPMKEVFEHAQADSLDSKSLAQSFLEHESKLAYKVPTLDDAASVEIAVQEPISEQSQDMVEQKQVVIEEIKPIVAAQVAQPAVTQDEPSVPKALGIPSRRAIQKAQLLRDGLYEVDEDPISMQRYNHAPTQNQMSSPPPVYVQPYQQPMMQPTPVMYQQPMMYQAQQNQMAMAMQMQAQAMAMQNQASMLMMQANQPMYQQPAIYQQPVQQPVYDYGSAMRMNAQGLSRQEKIQKLMNFLQQLTQSGGNETHRLLSLVDMELDIIENLLANSTGQIVDRLVFERNQILKQSMPLIAAAYDLIIDIATCQENDNSDSRLYHYFVRKGKKSRQSQVAPQGRKKFLLGMMSALQEEYEMIENMQRVVSHMRR